jgi:hypothetical protein
MPIATLIDDQGRQRQFSVPFCCIYFHYAGQLWARQCGGGWDDNSTYRAAHLMTLDDSMIVPKKTASIEENSYA